MEYFYYVLQGIIALLGLYLAMIIVLILVGFVFALFVRKKDYDTHSRVYRNLLNFLVGVGLFVIRVKINVEGKEKLDSLGKFLIVSNHRSNLDPVATFYCLKKHDISFISKADNFKVVIFGRLIRKCCFRAIDRENPRNAIKTIRDCASLMQKDQVSIGVYPEGTRSKTGELLAFHDGVFKIASLASVPLVIATVNGGENFKKRFPFRKTVINLKILEVVDKDRVKEFATRDLAEYAREKIDTDLKTLIERKDK